MNRVSMVTGGAALPMKYVVVDHCILMFVH